MKNKIDELFLKNICTVLSDNKIEYWIDEGTLLGFVREGYFIEWDRDIDIGVEGDSILSKWFSLEKDFKAKGINATLVFSSVWLKNQGAGFRNTASLEMHWRKKENLIYIGINRKKNKVSLFNRVLKKFMSYGNRLLSEKSSDDQLSDSHTNFLIGKLKIQSALRKSSIWKFYACLPFHKISGTVYNKKFDLIFPLKSMKIFDNFTIFIPGDCTKHLEQIYGNEWMKPNKNFDKSCDYRNVD